MKNEALEPLNKVNDVIIDDYDVSYMFYPWVTWALFFIIIFVGFESILQIGIYYAIAFASVNISIAYGVELLATFVHSKENNMVYYEKAIIYFDGAMMVLAIILILIFSTHNVTYYLYPSSVFLISFSILNMGLVFNKNYFKYSSIFGFIASLCMFSGFLYFGENAFNHTEKYISAIVSGMSLFYIAIMSKKS